MSLANARAKMRGIITRRQRACVSEQAQSSDRRQLQRFVRSSQSVMERYIQTNGSDAVLSLTSLNQTSLKDLTNHGS